MFINQQKFCAYIRFCRRFYELIRDDLIIEEDLMSIDKSSQDDEMPPSLMEVLSNKSFFIAFSGHIFEMLGASAMYIALMFLIYSYTQSVTMIGIFQIVTMLPAIFLAPFAGVIVDRTDQRKIMLFSIAIRLVTAVGLAIVYFFHNTIHSNLYLILLYVIFTIRVSIWPFFSPAKSAYTKLIIPKRNLLKANSFSSTALKIAGVLGPIISGALIAINYSIGFIFAIAASTISILFFLLLVFTGQKPPTNEHSLEEFRNSKSKFRIVADDFKVGIDAIKSSPKIGYVIVILAFVHFAFAGIDIMWPVILQSPTEMNLNSTWFGAMESVIAGAAILAGLVVMFFKRIDRKIILMTGFQVLEGLAMILMAFIRNEWLMIFLIMLPFGIVNGFYNIAFETLVQENTPYEKQGRVFSVEYFLSSLTLTIGLTIITLITMFIENIPPGVFLYIAGGIELVVLLVGFLFIFKKKLYTSDYPISETIVQTKDIQ